jgi:hypothetical protein
MRRSFFLSSSVLLLLAGCPSSSANDGGTDAPAVMDGGADGGGSDGGGSDGGGSDGGGSDGGGSDGGGSTARGDCASTTDCPAGGMCIELVPGGYRVCQVPPVEATSCEAGRSDECCNGSECATGDCFLGPIRRFCGGAKRLPLQRVHDRSVCVGRRLHGRDLRSPRHLRSRRGVRGWRVPHRRRLHRRSRGQLRGGDRALLRDPRWPLLQLSQRWLPIERRLHERLLRHLRGPRALHERRPDLPGLKARSGPLLAQGRGARLRTTAARSGRARSSKKLARRS